VTAPIRSKQTARYNIPFAVTRDTTVSDTINARIPLRTEQKQADSVNPYSLAADLIPQRGVKTIQSGRIRELARKAFRGPRAR